MKVILIRERLNNRDSVLIIEDDGTPDGGRAICRVSRYPEARAICAAMGWQITDDEFGGPISTP